MIEHFMEVFNIAARQAGYVARHLQKEVSLQSKSGEKYPEGEALTAVDLAAQDVILSLLHASFPDSAVDAEEDTATVDLFGPALTGKPLIVVDPIDGTLNYSRGSQEYAVMAALLEEDRYRAALVHFPAVWKTYRAQQGHGCWTEDKLGDRRIKIGALPQRVLVTPAVSDNYRSALRDTGFEVVVSRCSAVDATAPVTGIAAAALSLGRPGRRRAVGFLLTTEAGGVVRIGDRWWNGEDPLSLPEGRHPTVVAGDRTMVERILFAIDTVKETIADV